MRRGGGVRPPPPPLGHQWSGNLMLPQKLGFAIFVAQKLWNWRPFSQKIPLRGQYIAILTLSPPITYLYVISSVPPPPNHVYIRERLGARFFISKMRAEDLVVWNILCDQKKVLEKIIRMTPKTRWKTEFCRLLSYRQSFVKSIGVFPGPWSILLKKHPVLKELKGFSSRLKIKFIMINHSI